MRPNEPERGLACHVCGCKKLRNRWLSSSSQGRGIAYRGGLDNSNFAGKFAVAPKDGSHSLAATGMKLRSVSGEVD
jgi:hypothetical protein